MSLLFTGAGTTRVSVGTSTSIISDVCTILAWIYPTSVTTPSTQAIIEKTPSDFSDYRGIQVDGTGLLAFIRRGSPAFTGTEVAATGLLSINTWQMVGTVMDATSSTATDQKLFYGSLTSMIAEVPSYSSQDAGSGATSQGSINTLIGNNGDGSFVSGFPGKIAWVATWNRILTLGEIQAQQFTPHVTAGCQLFIHCGFNGTGTQPDWSGNGRNGTVTGATTDSHIPLRIFPSTIGGWRSTDLAPLVPVIPTVEMKRNGGFFFQ